VDRFVPAVRAVSQHSLAVGTLPPSEQAAAGPLVARGFIDGLHAGMRISAVGLAVGAALALAFLPSARRSAAETPSAERSVVFE
jgi:hypothetical protein